MTSKEKLERIENFIDGSPITKEYREKLNADVKEIEKDLEILEQIKALVEKYNNDEIHFTRGFDFINIVKEVLNNG